MNAFDLRDRVVSDYASYIRSFIKIADPEISKKIHSALSEGKLWPDPLLQFNPAYEQAGTPSESWMELSARRAIALAARTRHWGRVVRMPASADRWEGSSDTS
jgi:hypothetical protein